MPTCKKKSADQRRKEQRERAAIRRNSVPEVREVERVQDAVNRRSARSIPEVRASERLREAESKRSARCDLEVRANKRSKDVKSKRSARSDPVMRANERIRDVESKKSARSDPEVRALKRSRDAESKRSARTDPVARANERSRDAESKRSARTDPVARANERSRDLASKRASRGNPEVTAIKRNRDVESRKLSRNNPKVRAKERTRDKASRSIARMDDTRRKRDVELNKIRRKRVTKSHDDIYQSNFKLYFDFIRRAPSFVCSCCGQTWYQESTVVVSEIDLLQCVDSETMGTILWVKQTIPRLCGTCYSYVKKHKIPKLALCNGLDFPEIPEELKILRPLESLLVSLRIPFMTIHAVGSERQAKLRGNVVNVPNDLGVCAETLPRRFNEASVVQLQFMRRMRYKKPYMFKKIRPYHVYKAMMFLMTTELYREANIVLSNDWSRFQEDDTLDFISDPLGFAEETGIINIQANDSFEAVRPSPASDSEDDSEKTTDAGIGQGAEETLIMEDVASIVKIAPAEDEVPIPLIHDSHAEEMSFPTIYCGLPRKLSTEIKLTYTDIAKSELRRYDRRATIATKVLYSFKKSYNEKIQAAYQICLRKKSGNYKLTAGEVSRPEILSNILQHDEGYGVFNKVRCTPAYWSMKSKNLVSMVRQLGKCSIFFTLSAAETKWTELIVILKQQVDQVILTEEEAKKLDREEVSRLIRSDPTTCMRHFEHRFDGFLKYLLKGTNGIFHPHEIVDHFFRLEFQARGSPHIHGLLWLNDTPVFAEGVQDSVDSCVSFIDKFITCERRSDQHYKECMGYQVHKHSHTCYKKSDKRGGCRFGFPRPPLNSTRILAPLPQDYNKQEREKHVEFYRSLQTRLTDMGRDFQDEIPFEIFLDSLGVTEKEYLNAIRSSIKRPMVFLKRSTKECFVNNYNCKMIEAWGANMDIQFVLDTYACARYCAGYITKPEGGLSKLLQAATKEVKLGNLGIRDKLKRFGNVLINGVEISVQEAVAFILGISMMQCSRQVIYINTSPACERISMLKSYEQLSQLSDDSEDICAQGLLDRYKQRPKDLESVCLAFFASNYEFESHSMNAARNTDNCEVHVHPPTGQPGIPFKRYKLLDDSGYLRVRRVAKVVRFRKYSEKADPSNFYREKLMLFVPWRSETTELVNVDVKTKYELNHPVIKLNSNFVYFRDESDEDLISAALDDQDELEEDIMADVIDNNQGLVSEEPRSEYFDELETRGPRVVHFLPPKLVDEFHYLQLMRSLNDRQRRLVLHVLQQLKSSNSAFHIFLHGGAGVGKSHTINAIVQSMLRWQATLPTGSPEDIPVIVTAPTGKAAFNVFGMTLHCAFKIPPTQSRTIVDLNDSTLNTLRAKFKGVKLIIIDEISMVSSKMFYQVDQRLRQIYACQDPFGGISVICVGHLRQLSPVAGSFVFKSPNHTPLAELVGNPLWELFQYYELVEIKRQSGQFEFCKALNNMSEGTMDEADIALISSREIPDNFQSPQDAIHLFFTNKECDDFNKQMHASMSTETAVSTAYDRIEGHASASAKRSLMEFAKNLSVSQSDGLRYEVSLQVDAMYFITTNVDVQDGLFNGATAKLKMIEYGSNSLGQKIPKCVWLDFNNPLIGCDARTKSKRYQLAKGIDLNWVKVERVTRNLKKRETDLLAIVRSQIPITAANGITVHKSQGSSLDCVVVNLKNPKRNSRELLYVACSRATHLERLYIAGSFQPPPCAIRDPVSIEIERMKRHPLEFHMRFFQDSTDVPKIFLHNVQSFILHREDLLADQCVQAADYIVLLEPKTISTDDVELDGFELIHRLDAPSHASSEGVLLFGKCGLSTPIAASSYTIQKKKSHMTVLMWNVHNVQIWTIYKSPQFPESDFLLQLEEMLEPRKRTIIMGDMNLNIQEQTTLNRVEQIIHNIGFSFKLDPNEPTTAMGTHIDWCLANFQSYASIYETYFSHHKAICTTFTPSNV